MRKVLGMTSALLVLLCLPVAAAGKSEAAGTGAAAAAQTNEYGWAVPATTTTITYYEAMQQSPDRARQATQLIGDYILKNFNVKLTKIAYDSDPKERLNLMLASNDYPDVIASVEPIDAQAWVNQGRVAELTPFLDRDAPNIKKNLGPIYRRLLDDKGRFFVMPVYWGYLPIPDYCAHLRWDWWQAMGAPSYGTPGQYFTVLKNMQALHPVNAKGARTYAISGYDQFRDIFGTLAGMLGLKSQYQEGADHSLTHWINTPEGLEMSKFMNRFYREGLLDPDAFLNDYEKWKAKFSDQRIMGHIGAWWVTTDAGHEDWAKTVPGWTEEMRYVHVQVKAPGVPKAYYSPKNTTGDYRTFVTNKCKDVEAVLRWWNFEVSDLGTRLIGWGVPNLERSVWNYKDGAWSFTDQAVKAFLSSTFDYDYAETVLGQVALLQVAGQGLMADGKTTVWFDQNFNDKDRWRKLMHQNLADTIYDYSAFLSVVLPPDQPIAVTDTQVQDLLLSGWPDVVTAPSVAECESRFYALRDTLNKGGMKDLEAYRTAAYKKNLAAWGQ